MMSADSCLVRAGQPHRRGRNNLFIYVIFIDNSTRIRLVLGRVIGRGLWLRYPLTITWS